MKPRFRTVAGVLAISGAGVAVGVAATPGVNPKDALSCVGALDPGGLDKVLAAAGSPLAGEGRTFVTAAASWGIDPRALVAIAAHETILSTYAPSQVINNPFGIGPGRRFETKAAAIAFAAELLARHYIAEGRRTLGEIAGKWAPLGVANDPANLNVNWTAGVGASYVRLGGNPDLPITLEQQASSVCQTTPAAPPPASTAPAAPPAQGTVAWNGVVPVVDAPVMERGADPSTGLAATIAGFVFPIVPGGTPIRYADDFSAPGAPGCYGKPMACAVTVNTDPGAVVVASAAGTLQAASATEQSAGLAFWVVTADGDRIGYSGLAVYAPGIADGVAVGAGQALGAATRETRLAWERAGQRVNPFPLLEATRPSDG
jgi:hypothetical protein